MFPSFLRRKTKNKIILFNETACIPHIGCLAVGDAHARILGGKGYEIEHVLNSEGAAFMSADIETAYSNLLKHPTSEKIRRNDIVIVNGEGTIHHQGGRNLLLIMRYALSIGKPTHLVNAVLEDVNGFDDVLSSVSSLIVRDQKSADYCVQKHIKHTLVLDSCLAANWIKRPFANFSNKIMVLDWHPAREHDVGVACRELLQTRQTETHWFPIIHGTYKNLWAQVPATLSTAKLIVTPRHHGVYLAGLAHAPFVAMPSNTYKVEGLIKTSGLPIPIASNIEELNHAIDFAMNNPDIFSQFSDWLYAQLPLQTFLDLPDLGANCEKEALNSLENAKLRNSYHFERAENWQFWPAPNAQMTLY